MEPNRASVARSASAERLGAAATGGMAVDTNRAKGAIDLTPAEKRDTAASIL